MKLGYWATLRNAIFGLPVSGTDAPKEKETEPARQPWKIKDESLGEFASEGERVSPWVPPQVAPGVIPQHRNGGPVKFANDSAQALGLAWANTATTTFSEGLQFMGYAYLAELTQRAEYRRPAEILAKNMTRKWISFSAVNDDDSDKKAERIKELEEEFKRLDVQNSFRKAVELDGYFGRSHIYIDCGVDFEQTDEIKTPMTLTKEKIGIGSFKGLRVVEPMWVYPANYNTTNPLSEFYYKAQNWYVMATTVDASRLLTIVTRPLPDMLKPAYAFGGLSLSQMAKPYVDNWLNTRQAVADLVKSFTIWVLKTDLSQILTGVADGAVQLKKRLMLLNRTKNARGVFALQKDDEEFDNITAPLTGLPELQAQTQEHMSAVTGIPLAILLGITPSGLNASSEGEIRIFYDWIEAQQESSLTSHVDTVMKVAMLSLWGEIDDGIQFTWNPLWTMSDKERGEIEKNEAESDNFYYQMGALDSEEIRTRLARRKDSPYGGLDLNKEIIPPSDENDEAEETGLESELKADE